MKFVQTKLIIRIAQLVYCSRSSIKLGSLYHSNFRQAGISGSGFDRVLTYLASQHRSGRSSSVSHMNSDKPRFQAGVLIYQGAGVFLFPTVLTRLSFTVLDAKRSHLQADRHPHVCMQFVGLTNHNHLSMKQVRPLPCDHTQGSESLGLRGLPFPPLQRGSRGHILE